MEIPNIIDMPINAKRYFKETIDYYKEKVDTATNSINKLESLKQDLIVKIKECGEYYVTYFNVNVVKHPEFVANKYINGDLNRVAKIIYDDKDDKPDNVRFACISLLKYSNIINKIHSLSKTITIASKISKLNYKEYINYLKCYYTEVQKRLILNGEAYYLGNNLGKICINRCLVTKTRPTIDFAASKQNKKKLIKEGVELFDKEKKAYYDKFGIEYHGVDWRIYKKVEAVYEIAYFGLNVINHKEYEFKQISHRDEECRKYTNKEISEMCKDDINKLFDLNIDMPTKLNIYLDINPNSYVKYVRNEKQTAFTYSKINRKD